MTFYLGILLSLACAFVTQLGFLYKHRGANEAASVDVRHPLRLGQEPVRIALVRDRHGCRDLRLAAPRGRDALAPLSVVQAVLSTGVVMLAVLAERKFGFKVERRQKVGVALTALGLILLVITLPTAPGSHSAFSAARDDRLRGRHARAGNAAHHR